MAELAMLRTTGIVNNSASVNNTYCGYLGRDMLSTLHTQEYFVHLVVEDILSMLVLARSVSTVTGRYISYWAAVCKHILSTGNVGKIFECTYFAGDTLGEYTMSRNSLCGYVRNYHNKPGYTVSTGSNSFTCFSPRSYISVWIPTLLKEGWGISIPTYTSFLKDKSDFPQRDSVKVFPKFLTLTLKLRNCVCGLKRLLTSEELCAIILVNTVGCLYESN